MTICITGAGILTSIGDSPENVFENLCNNISGLKSISGFTKEKFNLQSAYEIDDRKTEGKDESGRSTRWLLRVIEDALKNASLEPGSRKMSVLVGTGLREHRSLELWNTEKQKCDVDSLDYGSAVRELLGSETDVTTIVNACAASNFGLGIAHDMISLGEADIVVVAGCDSITESMFGLLGRANPVIPEALRPFEKNRKGVIMGEGAAAVVLERQSHADARNASPIVKVRGVGMSCDAYHETAPDIDGIKNAISDAHKRSSCSVDDIDLIMAHGTGTIANDMVEAQVLADLFESRTGNVAVSAIKSMTGHTSGASGLIGVVIAMEAMRTGKVPPTLGLEDVIESASCLNFVKDEPLEVEIRIAQINAFGFGGVNAVAILEQVS